MLRGGGVIAFISGSVESTPSNEFTTSRMKADQTRRSGAIDEMSGNHSRFPQRNLHMHDPWSIPHLASMTYVFNRPQRRFLQPSEGAGSMDSRMKSPGRWRRAWSSQRRRLLIPNNIRFVQYYKYYFGFSVGPGNLSMAVFILIYRSHSYRWAAIVPRSNYLILAVELLESYA